MKYGSLIMEKKEYVYLKKILNISGYAEDFQTLKSHQKLLDELKTAQIVDNGEMPLDVIRFNSKVTIIFNNGIEKTIQIVAPTDKDVKNNKISILTPMGAALIGYSKGDIVTWEFPMGQHEIKIIEVQQEKTFNNINITI
ncbi:regulator of nucleoside diphosphate kinase [Mesoflavibacter sabulilitoris]|uniref:Transcription elongation factor GreAB n=1 Tax=Mesoflavibacter zeaxanthinifaciens subsp. sabulilitoris TaxID=1520893 RepID=A0A2T1NF83_9FLAO|nr:GreA/GreB family elongation factor [Mesoflavibacter zeaxanthinifaciens]MBB3124808.1 regulator of nucleoside diphosphate kinase [Mesoflavibacter zeaxanthinifaciens subsp. sabulilitoris]PSG91101.1 transcription elongation factor GreAB [Mesoflavibacter zeaxanthinifaciens subsp. sabulilitoris]